MRHRPLGLVAALTAAGIVAVSLATWASVVPTEGFYRLTLAGSSSTSETTTTAPTYSLAYVSPVDSTIVGVIADSRAVQAQAVIGEFDATLSGNGDISATRRRYYWYGLTGMNQSDTYTETFSGSFSTATYASGTWSSNYYTSGKFYCSRPVTNPVLQTGPGYMQYWTYSDTDNVWCFDSYTMRFTGQRANPWMRFTVDADTIGASGCTTGLRVLVFNDSTGLVMDSTMTVSGYSATESLYHIHTPIETNCVSRVWVLCPAESGMQWGFRILVNASATTPAYYDATAPVTLTLDTTGNKRLALTASIPADAIWLAQWSGTACTTTINYLGNPNSAGYLQADTNTGFSIVGETTASSGSRRVSGTTFSITAMDNDGFSYGLATGKFITVSIDLTHLGLNITDTASLRLYRLDRNKQKWVSAGTNQYNTGNTLTCEVTHLSEFALVRPPSSSSTAEDDSSDCLITDAIGGTALARIMPSLRGVRDAMMANALGRLFVFGYYGFSAMMLLAAGLGLTAALKRR